MYLNIIILFLYTSLSGQFTASTAVCPQKYKVLEYDGQKHSRCLEKAATFTSGGVSTGNEKDFIVSQHNVHRAAVSPPAQNMIKMTWDEELAETAFGWAAQCKGGHETSFYWRQIPGKFTVGQNVAGGSQGTSWSQVISAWQKESEGFIFGKADMTFEDRGHYTQMVWHDSSKIGCAAAVCGNTKYFVCNYAPGGNINPGWYTPYTKAETDAEKCGMCKERCSNNMCDLDGFVCYNNGKLNLETKSCLCDDYSPAVRNGPQCHLDCSKMLPDVFRQQLCPKPMSDCLTYPTSALRCPDSCRICPSDSGSSDSGNQGSSGNQGNGGKQGNGGSGSNKANSDHSANRLCLGLASFVLITFFISKYF